MCNFWFVVLVKNLINQLSQELINASENICLLSRLSTIIDNLIQYIYKEFNSISDYYKVNGGIFRDWMSKYHSFTLLITVERALGCFEEMSVCGSICCSVL